MSRGADRRQVGIALRGQRGGEEQENERGDGAESGAHVAAALLQNTVPRIRAPPSKTARTFQQLSFAAMRFLRCCLLLVAANSFAAVDPTLFKDLHWRLLGPFRAGRVLAVTGVPGEAEHFYFGS